MPTKRKNTRKPTNPGLPRAFGRARAGGKKQEALSLNLVLKRLDKIDQRFDAIDQRFDAVDQKVDAFRQETTAEFKAVREEMTQGLHSLRQDFTTKFDSLHQELTTRMDGVSEAAYQHYLRIENEAKASSERYEQRHNQLLTAMDTAAKNYDDFKENKDSFNERLNELQHEVKELKKHDMEKAAAIEKIEKQLKAA
jgi:chromosome segregation ATPase